MKYFIYQTAKKTTQECLFVPGASLVENVKGADKVTKVITNYMS